MRAFLPFIDLVAGYLGRGWSAQGSESRTGDAMPNSVAFSTRITQSLRTGNPLQNTSFSSTIPYASHVPQFPSAVPAPDAHRHVTELPLHYRRLPPLPPSARGSTTAALPLPNTTTAPPPQSPSPTLLTQCGTRNRPPRAELTWTSMGETPSSKAQRDLVRRLRALRLGSTPCPDHLITGFCGVAPPD